MDLAWGDRFGETIAGLDIAGVRGLDQKMEAMLVNGITTISPRGRYFTILCWAASEFFEQERSGSGEFEADRLGRFLARVEFLVLACTFLDAGSGSNASTLGFQKYEATMQGLSAGRLAKFPDEKRSAMMAAYLGPCRAIGLFGDPAVGSPVNFGITPRGQEVWRMRSAALADAGWAAALSGDSLAAHSVLDLIPHFSLKRLLDFPAEAAALRKALSEPWSDGAAGEAAITGAYGRFRQTVDWLRDQPRGPGAQSLNAAAVMHRALVRAVKAVDPRGGIGDAWAECEWRRRLHYAVELVLSAVAGTVGTLRTATVGEVVDEWLRPTPGGDANTPRLLELWPEASQAWSLSSREAAYRVSPKLFLDAPPPGDLTKLPPGARALAAFALVSSLARQSATLRADGVFRDFETVGERVLACVEESGGSPFRAILERFAGIAVASHLAHTLRKMGSGQHCSLRFFPEGARLVAMDTPTGANWSGSRLPNVVSILRDAGEPGIGAI